MQYHEPAVQSRHNPDNHLPAYARISQSLRRQIESKAWQPGDLIPTESRLSKEHGVSIGTVRKALQELVIAGFLYRVQGKGTYVLQLSENSPVLFLEMLSCSYNEIPYEYRQSFCVPGRKLFRSY